MHVGCLKSRLCTQKILKEPIKYEVSARSRQTNHCLSLMIYLNPSSENYMIKISWNIASSCHWNMCDQRERSPNPAESHYRKSNRVSERDMIWADVKGKKMWKLKMRNGMLTKNNMTAFESGEYSFAIQDIWAEGVWGNHNIEVRCSVEKGVRMKTEK